ncbi:MAG: helix-turn-helix transcriptional regulator [Bacteroides sp.]|nr:helix-turn-helix transcriptional regulator [Bacteroides sp.]
MAKVKVFIAREKDGSYSCYPEENNPMNYGLLGEGKTPEEAIEEWHRMYEAMKEGYAEDNKPFNEVEFYFVYDVPSIVSYYADLITYKGLSKLTGISAAQLSQYASGYRNPSPKTTEKIQNGLNLFGHELSQVSLV